MYRDAMRCLRVLFSSQHCLMIHCNLKRNKQDKENKRISYTNRTQVRRRESEISYFLKSTSKHHLWIENIATHQFQTKNIALLYTTTKITLSITITMYMNEDLVLPVCKLSWESVLYSNNPNPKLLF